MSVFFSLILGRYRIERPAKLMYLRGVPPEHERLCIPHQCQPMILHWAHDNHAHAGIENLNLQYYLQIITSIETQSNRYSYRSLLIGEDERLGGWDGGCVLRPLKRFPLRSGESPKPFCLLSSKQSLDFSTLIWIQDVKYELSSLPCQTVIRAFSLFYER